MGQIKKSRTLMFTTSPRSPSKLIPEIELLIRHFEGSPWNRAIQRDFAVVLAEAATFKGDTSKKYTDFSARDRITRSPQGLGFVDLSPRIGLTEAGKAFVNGNRPHEIFFRQLLKFQIPSPYLKETKKIKGTFWGHPYLEIIRLIRDVEYLTPDEFRIFALQLTDYRNYDTIKNKILKFRVDKKKRIGQYKQFVDAVFNQEIRQIYAIEIATGDIATRESETHSEKKFIATQRQNMRDYADACFRYLRYTDMFTSDGKSIKIASDKLIEIDYILSKMNREPVFVDNIQAYKLNLFDVHTPTLYTDLRENIEDILMRLHSFTKRELLDKSIDELKDLRDAIVENRRKAFIKEQEIKLKSYDLYEEVIETYNDILQAEVYDAPLFLEWNTWRAMTMLDGGQIKGNFKIDDLGKPLSTAQGNMPDIECDYEDFALSVEVTLQRGQRQYEAEGEPVTRHYGKLLQKSGKETYCLFIAPVISKATWAHFFGLNQIKNISAYGGKPKIVPLELEKFISLIQNSYNYHDTPKSSDVKAFLQKAIDEIEESQDEKDWMEKIHQCADNWLLSLV